MELSIQNATVVTMNPAREVLLGAEVNAQLEQTDQ